MKKYIYDDKSGLGYRLYGEYYLPDLELMEDEEACYGKYGMLRKTYLMEHRKPYYQMLMLQGKLNKHLNRIDREAHERMDILVAQMAEKQGVTELFKAEQPMLWVQKMNRIKTAVEAIVFTEIIYECFLLGKHTVERVCSGLSPLRRDRLWC